MDRPSTAPPIEPSEIGWSVALAGSSRNHTMMVTLSVFTAQGEQHYFFDGPAARSLAEALAHVAVVVGEPDPADDVLPASLNAWLRLHADGARCNACTGQGEPCVIPPEDGE